MDKEELKKVKKLIERVYNKEIELKDIRCITLKTLEYVCTDYPVRIYIFIDEYAKIYIVKKFATGELKLKVI